LIKKVLGNAKSAVSIQSRKFSFGVFLFLKLKKISYYSFIFFLCWGLSQIQNSAKNIVWIFLRETFQFQTASVFFANFAKLARIGLHPPPPPPFLLSPFSY